MLIDASHRKWMLGFTLATVVALATYIPYHLWSLNGPSGGSWPGLIYGIIGSALMLFAGLLSLRRKVPVWRIGRADLWLKGHIWLGLLSLPLILFHSGFRFGGPLTTVLMILFLSVIVSGLWGLILQQFLPRMLMERVPAETIWEQLDQVLEQLQADADELVEHVCGPLDGVGMVASPGAMSSARVKGEGKLKGKVVKSKVKREAARPVAGSEPLKTFYLEEARPFLEPGSRKSHRLATHRQAAAAFDHLRTLLPLELHEAIDELETLCEERRQLALQDRLHRWLHGWLFVHVPLSMAVLVLAVVHIVMSLRY